MNDTDIAVFSEEEQKEIIAQIEAAAQRGPMEPSRLPSKGEALKRSFFPLVVNVTAAALLCAGIFFMIFFQREGEVEIRESGAVLGITERKLIQEIRRETNRQISEKEAAIEAMSEKITEVDAELARLDSLEALTDEQRAAMSELHRQQDEYRLSLQTLQGERAQILAEARQREAALNARLEEQQGALENLSAKSRAEILAAREELAKLSGDQEKSALVEKQLGAYFASAGREIQAGQYKEASETLAGLREFLATPSFQTLRSIQARRESDLAAASALSALVAEALAPGRHAQAAGPAGNAAPESGSGQAETALQLQQQAVAEKDRAEQAIAERDKTLAAREQSLAELQKNITELQARNAGNLQTITERERQIENLRAQNTAYAQTIDTQQKTIAALNAELEKR
jgi:chromosome segregation ATPase